MAVFRFSTERDFIRFLNDTDCLRGGAILAVVRKGEYGGAVEIVTRPLADDEFEKVVGAAAAYQGRPVPDAPQEASTRGMDSGRYIETIRPERAIAAPEDNVPISPDLLLLVRDGEHRFERARDLVFRFGCDGDFLVMSSLSDGERFFLLRIQGLRSSYPILSWEGDDGYGLYVPVAGNAGCYIQRGWQFPLRDLHAYHPRLRRVNLIGADGRWWTSESSDFLPMGDVSDVTFGGAYSPRVLRASDRGDLPRFPVTLKLEREELGAGEPTERQPSDADSAAGRLQQLEEERWRLDAEIDRLRHRNGLRPVLYAFPLDKSHALVRLVTRHPLGILRGFSYGLLPGKQAADRIHIVMPEDIGHPQFLPPDAVRDSALYDLHESWYARHRVPVFLPRGYRLVPPLDFSSIESLGAILGGVTEGHVFVLRRAPDGGIELGVIPPGGRVPLEAAVEYLNGAVHSGTEALHEVLARSMADEHERAATAIRQDLGRAQREIEEAFRTALMHSEEELNRALQRLRESRNSLGLYRDLLVFLESLEDQAAAFRSGHLSALRDLLVGLEQSLGQVLAKPGGEPSAMADQFHAVLRQWDELRQRQAAEVQAIRGRIDRFLLGHGARREEMARQVDRVLSRWEKEPVAGDVSDMLQVLRDVREKLR